MRSKLSSIQRYIVSPRVAKHRIFVWADVDTIPDCQLIVFARDDDFTFGVLHSHAHELWSLRMCTWLGVGNDPRYTPTTCFETFPFPRANAQQQVTIGAAAQRLVQQRDIWLNPPDATESELKKRTLTALYNARPQWLANAHAQLDGAVYAAYGWPADISDDAILEALLSENLTRAGAGTPIAAITAPEEIDDSDEDAESDE